MTPALPCVALDASKIDFKTPYRGNYYVFGYVCRKHKNLASSRKNGLCVDLLISVLQARKKGGALPSLPSHPDGCFLEP